MSSSYVSTRNEHNDPVVTITLVGVSDIHRFAYNLLSQQVEFAEMGRNILKGQRRRMGKVAWDRMWKTFHGSEKPLAFSWKRDI